MCWYKNRIIVNVALTAIAGSALVFALSSPLSQPAPKDINQYKASSEQGRYLARAGNCATCHTAEGGQPFAGGVPFQTPFGTIYSTNITMDKATGIGDWSFQDFYNSMKHGVRPDGAHLYPAFPYTDFARMSDEDIASLFLFIQTIEPVNAPAKSNELEFPYNQRRLLSVWKALYHDADTLKHDPARSDAWNRGRYLVEGPGHCGACHTPRGALGAETEELALTGGVYTDKVKLGWYRKWSAVNLTPHESGLAAWSEDDLVAYLKEGTGDRSVVQGPMTHVVMNSTRHLSEEDVRAMAIYLKGIPARAAAVEAVEPTQEALAEGEIVYNVHCGSCHLPDGLGREGGGVPLAGSPVVLADDPSSLINVILYGAHLPPRPFVTGRNNMEMFGKRLSDRKIADVATYVRSSFGNSAGAVAPEHVKEQR